MTSKHSHRLTPLLLAASLLFPSLCRAENTPEDADAEKPTAVTTVQVGRLEVGFDSKGGLFASLDSVPIIEKSDFLLRKDAWRQTVDRLGRAEMTLGREERLDAAEITARSVGDPFEFAYRITVPNETEVGVRFYYNWRGPDVVRLEYCAAMLAANPIKGAGYTTLHGEETTSGRLPVGIPSIRWLADPFELPFHRLAIDSRFGALGVEVDTQQPFKLRRLASVTDEHHAGSMAFWMGWRQKMLSPGEEGICQFRLRLPPEGRGRKLSPHPGGGLVAGPPLDLDDAIAPERQELRIIPAPQQVEPLPEDFVLDNSTRIVAAGAVSEEDRRAAISLQAYLRERFGLALTIESSSSGPAADNCVVIGQPLLAPEVAELCLRHRLSVTPHDPGPEGYALLVQPEVVVLAGADPAGMYYGAQTLRQLVDVGADEKIVIRGARVRDWPDFGFRGVHLLADDHALELHTQLITKLLAPLKVNNLLLECEYGKWDSHPEIAQPWGMSKQDMRALKEVAEEHFIRITPLVQSLGHCEWMFVGGQHADLVEDPERPYAYCPSNPKSHELLFDIYDEALEVFESENLHIGHDEVASRGRFGQCARCAEIPPAMLFAANVRKIHRYLKDKGVRTMMWGDMLLQPEESEDAAHGGEPYRFADARPVIPRDVLLFDWHYSPYRDYPSTRVFAREGFEVVSATWHNQKNIYYFSRSAKRYNAAGLLQTTWTGHSANRQAARNHPEQLHAYVTAAEFAWTAAKPPLDQLGYQRAEVFHGQMFPRPAVLRRAPGFQVPLDSVANVNLADNRVPGDWLGYTHAHDLRRMPRGKHRINNVSFRLIEPLDNGRRAAVMLAGKYTAPGMFPEEIIMPLGRAASDLVFVHTTAWPVVKGTTVGEYRIYYSDGACKTVSLRYGDNIHAWDDETPTYSESLLWSGKTIGGVPVSLGSFDWANPRPHDPLDRIVLATAGTEASPVLLAVTGIAPPGPSDDGKVVAAAKAAE